jgi:hypothetical protein
MNSGERRTSEGIVEDEGVTHGCGGAGPYGVGASTGMVTSTSLLQPGTSHGRADDVTQHPQDAASTTHRAAIRPEQVATGVWAGWFAPPLLG